MKTDRREICRILILSALCIVAAFSAFAAEPQTRVVLLGTGTPSAEPDRSGPAVAVVVGGQAYLVDFGPGVVRRASAAYARGCNALAPTGLDIAFLTHLHSDHTAGYPDLILTPWVLGRNRPLRVFGPPGIRNMTEHVLKAYEEDIRNRTEGLEQKSPIGCRVDALEVRPGPVYEDARVKVRAFPVNHGTWKHAYGYRFETRDRVVVVSGDTTPCEALVENASGCDVLVHEVYCEAGLRFGPASFREYHSKSHTSTRQLARIASRVRPKLLVLYHLLSFGCGEERMLEEIRQGYDGKVVIGQDLGMY